MSMLTNTFTFSQSDKTKDRPEAIKWTRANVRYEIHTNVLDELDVATLVPHCLDVSHKVKAVVTTDNHLGPSLFAVFPRTLSATLRSMWDIIVANGGAALESELAFSQKLRDFIAAHSTAEDRHDLAQQLSTATKPRDVPVQAFFYRIHQLNGYIRWLPGDANELTDVQLKQAFHDAMPLAWKERLVQAGRDQRSMTLAEQVRYFRSQEQLAQRKQAENTASQRKASKVHKGVRKNAKPELKMFKATPGSAAEKFLKGANKSTRIGDDTPCPIHPGMGHTWGSCRLNAKNKNAGSDNSHKKTYDNNQKTTTTSETKGFTKRKANNYAAQEESSESDDDTIMSHTSGSSKDMKGEFIYSITDETAQHPLNNFCCDLQTDFEIDMFSNLSVVADDVYAIGEYTVDHCFTTYSDTVLYQNHLRPITTIIVKDVQSHGSTQPLKALLDTGSDRTFIVKDALPKGVTPNAVDSVSYNTLRGSATVNKEVTLSNIVLPEFSPTRRIDATFKAFVVDHKLSHYDIIVGLDILKSLGIEICCGSQNIRWSDITVAWKPRSHFAKDNFERHLQEMTESFLGDSEIDNQPGSNEILESKYDDVSTAEVARQQQHLSPDERDNLAEILKKFQSLFNGKLKAYPGYKVHLDIDEKAKPFSCRPYPVPHAHRDVFKQELERLIEAGVLSPAGPSAWLSPTFIIPKKDGRVRWISDFRALNKVITRRVYNLPRIHDILKKA
jgi:hypothetical protein